MIEWRKLNSDGLNIFKHKSGRRFAQLKRYLDEQEGTILLTIFGQIYFPFKHKRPNALGYPTQKPLALLERIIQASSNPGDIVLDPFSGCGTAIAAAQKLGRRWIGIDITHLAIAMHKSRLKDMYGSAAGKGLRCRRRAGRPERRQSLIQAERLPVPVVGDLAHRRASPGWQRGQQGG